MRWFSRRTPSGGRHAAATGAGARVVHPPTPVTHVDVVPTAGSGVYLGFADGVVLQLDAADPRAGTFRSLARSLAQASP
jgi:hypothetical protein